MPAISSPPRRHFIRTGALATALSVLMGQSIEAAGAEPTEPDADRISANEDLMREHGLIRRILLVYAEAARRVRSEPASLALPALGDTARLMRAFGEDYHERALEEAYLFPVVRASKGALAKLPDILLEQHKRGRQLTDYVLQTTAKPASGLADGDELATVLEDFVRMYEAHAAREDTELFPAWKAALGAQGYAEMGERFEEIEKKIWGGDGFQDALVRITRIERVFDLADLALVTAPPPHA